MGKPAWGPNNFQPILESLGFKSYEPRGEAIVQHRRSLALALVLGRCSLHFARADIAVS
jgi:hypothetical protein